MTDLLPPGSSGQYEVSKANGQRQRDGLLHDLGRWWKGPFSIEVFWMAVHNSLEYYLSLLTQFDGVCAIMHPSPSLTILVTQVAE